MLAVGCAWQEGIIIPLILINASIVCPCGGIIGIWLADTDPIRQLGKAATKIGTAAEAGDGVYGNDRRMGGSGEQREPEGGTEERREFLKPQMHADQRR